MLDGLWGDIAGALMCLVSMGFTVRAYFRRHALIATIEKVGKSLGLRTKLSCPVAYGLIDGAKISVGRFSDAPGERMGRLRVLVSGAAPRVRVGRAHSGVQFASGDAAFDAKVRVAGPRAQLLALLDHETRERLCTAVEADIEVINGNVCVEPSEWSAQQIIQLCELCLGLAERLRLPDSTRALLAHNTAHDPVVGFRAACLAQLVTDFPDSSYTVSALALALNDTAPQIRRQAAVAARDLAALGVLILDRTLEDGFRAECVVAYCGLGPDPQLAAELFMQTLSSSQSACRQAVFEAAVVLELSLGVGSLTLNADDSEQCGLANIRALLVAPNAGTEAALSERMGARHYLAVSLEAAHALGRVGSIRAIPALTAFGRLNRGTHVARTHGANIRLQRKAALDAISAIQSRATGGAVGQLSLSTFDRAGWVAVVESPDQA